MHPTSRPADSPLPPTPIPPGTMAHPLPPAPTPPRLTQAPGAGQAVEDLEGAELERRVRRRLQHGRHQALGEGGGPLVTQHVARRVGRAAVILHRDRQGLRNRWCRGGRIPPFLRVGDNRQRPRTCHWS